MDSESLINIVFEVQSSFFSASEIDKMAVIYFPVADLEEEKNINLFFLNDKNNLFDEKNDNEI